MRRYVLMALAALALLPAAARADTTLHYVPETRGGLRLTVEIDGAGHARAEGSGGLVLIVRDGLVYRVLPLEIDHAAAQVEDVVAATAEARVAQSNELFQPRAPAPHALSAHGSQAVGQWRGALYAIDPVTPARGETRGDYVISTDPALAPLAPIVAALIDAREQMTAAALGIDNSNYDGILRELLGRGLLLRMVGNFHLESISNAPIAATRFDLPGPLLSRDQVRARQQ